MVLYNVSAQEGSQAVHLVRSVVRKLCKIIWPGDLYGFFRALESQGIEENKLSENAQAVVNALPTNSVQSNELLAVFARTYDLHVC